MRSKWDKVRGAKSYGDMTIEMVRVPLVSEKFIMCALINEETQKQIKKLSKQTAQANLFQAAIAQLFILLPPYEEQVRIVSEIENIMPYCEKLNR